LRQLSDISTFLAISYQTGAYRLEGGIVKIIKEQNIQVNFSGSYLTKAHFFSSNAIIVSLKKTCLYNYMPCSTFS